MMYTRQEKVQPRTTAPRRLVTAAALATISVLGLVTAAPASAAGKQGCGTYICVSAAFQGTHYVQSITVWTKDGQRGKLRAFAGDWKGEKPNDDHHTFPGINRELGSPGTKLLVCGGLDRSGRFIENHCIKIP
ncbi:hypothetical protein ACIP88_00080 [Streptomyces uncialis]|uniref:hypothetical protein n=1 Tax=Streptomyces uncialis TaxID=1048205 RepID=UPI00381A3D43